MPLSTPKPRQLQHTRKLDLRAYYREDNLWDIEGHLIDVKPFDFDMVDASRSADEPIHDMWLRITIDDEFLVRDVTAHMDTGAHFVCHLATPNFSALIGLKIGPGWNRKLRERLQRSHSCTHLIEMLGQMATTAMQAVWSKTEQTELGESPENRSLSKSMVDSCYAYRSDSPYVEKYYPQSYKPTNANSANDSSE